MDNICLWEFEMIKYMKILYKKRLNSNIYDEKICNLYLNNCWKLTKEDEWKEGKSIIENYLGFCINFRYNIPLYFL